MTTRTFLGLTVDGEITEGSKRKTQRPLEELQPIMQAVLDDPTIVEFGWRQYTPYFNDGEPCVFGVQGLWIRTTDTPAADDEDDDDTYRLEMYSHPALGKRPRTWNSERRDYDEAPYEGPNEARYDRCRALEKAIEGGEFENVLLDAFGDHAEVTVKRDGIDVEFYSHD